MKKICLVSDSGGHLEELLEISEAFQEYKIIYLTYDDVFTRDLDNAYRITFAKNIGLSVIFLCLRVFWIMLKERPDFIISTGSYIAIPAFYFGKFILKAKLIFVECSAQVFTASRTGRWVYPIADLFLTQWESLLKCYGRKARYVGGLI
ncbi:MAG: PssD/Cps14F family polysaccharide biosynthesis glycosyltransferase [Candidatus Omnitrophota bacterium]